MRYGVPALLSLIIPGFGQLAKRQTGIGLRIIGGTLGLTILATIFWATSAKLRADLTPYVWLEIGFLILAGVAGLAASAVWLWGVIDAYNRPAD